MLNFGMDKEGLGAKYHVTTRLKTTSNPVRWPELRHASHGGEMQSNIMSFIRVPNWKDDLPIIVTSTLVLGVVARLALKGRQHDKIFRSPLETAVPNLTEKEKHELPYPPDLLPGARDVNTPVC